MKKILIVILVVVNIAFLQWTVLASELERVKVVRVVDGDTIVVRYKNKNRKLRFWGVDTPEYHQAYSKVAKRFTTDLVKDSIITVETKYWDDYGRMVSIVTLRDNRILNEELIKSGLAWVHIYYCNESICDKWYQYEAIAKNKKRGLWHDRNPTPPWVWKRKKK